MQPSYSTSKCLANYIVISLIPILFFLSIVAGYVGIIPLTVPFHAVIIITFILFIFLLFIKHNANYSICKMRSSYVKLGEDIASELKSNNLTMDNKTKSILDIKKFLYKYYSNVRNDNFVSVASSVFPMLGILGTFIAIAISMPNFSVTDTKELDGEISKLLGGVGSAFFASIYGILLSLIWTYFEKRGLSKIDKYFADIHKIFEKDIWTEEELLIHKYTQEDIKDNKFVSALKDTFSLDFIQTLNQQQLNNFKSVMHETNHNFTQISNHLEFVSTELKDTLSQIDNSQSALRARKEIESSLTEFTLATNSFEKNTKIFSEQLNNSLNTTFTKIDSEIGGIVIKLADFATHVSLESKEVQDSIKKYHQLISNQIAKDK